MQKKRTVVKNKRISLDIDGVIACFVCGVLNRAERMKLGSHFPKTCAGVKYWNISDKLSEVMKDAWADPRFWLSLKPKMQKIPFEIDCYITSRPISSEITKQWLEINGFPEAEVITVAVPADKLQFIKDRKIDVFVDDYYPTVQEILDIGVQGLLYKAPYQKGHKKECKKLPTIKTLTEVLDYV